MKTAANGNFDMKRFLLLCWQKLLVTLVVSAVAGAVLFLVADIVRVKVLHGEKIYRSEALYYITFDAEDDGTIVHYYNDYTWNDVLDTDRIAGAAAQKLGISKEEVAAATSIPTMSDIKMIKVYADMRDAEEAERCQDAIGEALADFGSSTEGFISIEAWNREAVTELKVRGYYGRFAAAGAVIGMIFGVLIMMLKYSLDDSIRVVSDVMAYTDVPVAGVLFNGEAKNKTCVKAGEKLAENLKELGLQTGGIKLSFAGIYADDKEVQEKLKQKLNIEDGKIQDGGKTVLLVLPWGCGRSDLENAINGIKIKDTECKAVVIADVEQSFYTLYTKTYL
ncbi:MAG: hypothetical protein IKO53_06450 [Lachnospiraceae bacterium]|nr:hypothetical protein [Lachnospiraceae bacterium]